jgi:hypothetical protein
MIRQLAARAIMGVAVGAAAVSLGAPLSGPYGSRALLPCAARGGTVLAAVAAVRWAQAELDRGRP